jgi:hypothetical protein
MGMKLDVSILREEHLLTAFENKRTFGSKTEKLRGDA